jgi:uncharacterized protein YjbI with pentapeptide repeats
MANDEQLSILKQGVEVWNQWRSINKKNKIDLSLANLSAIDLRYADLSEADLTKSGLIKADLFKTNLNRANLLSADLSYADLTEAYLPKANLEKAYLYKTICIGAHLKEATLDNADLFGADFTSAQLNGAQLRGTNLFNAKLNRADLSEADFIDASLITADLKGAIFWKTNFTRTTIGATDISNDNFSNVIGLNEVRHSGPSNININTLQLSKGKIPDVFLRGCGLSDWEVEQVKLYNPDLSNEVITQIQYKVYELRATQSIQISPLFISYSQKDSMFVDKLESKLNQKGIRFWRDIHEMKAGRLEKQIDQAISQNQTVLLVLSENSIKSDWVEHEVRTARELEKKIGRDMLCPVALDNSWKSSPWPKRIIEQIMEYNILDFSIWKDDVKFTSMFRKLIDGLELFYKDKSHGE